MKRKRPGSCAIYKKDFPVGIKKFQATLLAASLFVLAGCAAVEKAAKDAYRAAMKTAKAEAKDAMSQAKEAQDAKIASLKEKHLEKVLAIKEEQKAIIARMRARNKEQVEIQKIKRALQRYLRRKAMGFEYREQVRALLAQYMKVPKWQASDVPQVSLEKFLDDKATVWGSVQLLQDARKALPAATRFMGDNQAAMKPARFSLEDWENIKDLTDSLIYMDKWERDQQRKHTEAKRVRRTFRRLGRELMQSSQNIKISNGGNAGQ